MNLNCFKIIYKDKPIEIYSYENYLQSIIMQVFDSKNKYNFILGLEREQLNIFLLVFYTINKYKENLINSNSTFFETIQPGDIVMYKGARHNFIETTFRSDKKYYLLRTKDKVDVFVPENLAYEIVLYKGQASTVNTSKAYKDDRIIGKRLISKIFDLNIKDLNGIITEKILILYDSKQEISDIIENIKIEFEGERYLFTSIFSCVYHTNASNYFFYKGNKEKGQPIIGITASFETAEHLIYNDKEIKDLIIIGGNLLHERIEGGIRRLVKRKSLNKAILIDFWMTKFSFAEIIGCDLDFSIYAMTKDSILDNVSLYDKHNLISESEIIRTNMEVLQAFVQNEFYSSIVRSDVDDIIFKLINYINKIKHIEDPRNQVFVIECFGLLKIFRSVLVPLMYLKETNEVVTRKISKLIELSCELQISDDIIYNEIIEMMIDLHHYYSFTNPKYDEFKKLEQKKSFYFIVKYKDEIDYLRYIYNVVVDNLFDLRFDGKVSNLFVSYYNDSQINKVFNSIYEEKVQLICKTEYIKFKYFYKSKIQEMHELNNRNQIKGEITSFYEELDDRVYDVKEDEIALMHSEVIDNSVFKEFILKNINEIVRICNTETSQNISTVEVKKLVIFKEERYALLSEYYVSDVVNYEKGYLEEKRIEELRTGDKLIFANIGKEKYSAVDAILEVMIKHDRLTQEQIGCIALNQLWKDKLMEYKKYNNLNYRDLSKLLGVEPQTINSWLEGEIIAPRNVNTFLRINALLNDSEVNNKITDIINASRVTRNIRIKARKILERLIISTAVEESKIDDELILDIKSKIGSLEDYIQILIIDSIEDYNETIISNNVNRPLILVEE